MTQVHDGHAGAEAARGSVGSGIDIDEMEDLVRANTHDDGCLHQFHWRMAPICLCGMTHRERYRLYLNTDEWFAVRDIVMERADFVCVDCGSDATEVHHTTYKRVFHEDPGDLVPLCRWCHKVRHDRIYIDMSAVVERAKRGIGRRYSRKDLIK